MARDWLIQAETICIRCGGQCCTDAQPPISSCRYQRLIDVGVPDTAFDQNGYRYIRPRTDGTCMFWNRGECSIHGIKPETCRAGPFTFDMRDDMIEIFIKFEKICPVVRLLREVPKAHEKQYAIPVNSITCLVSNLTDEEHAAICGIEEPETEKVAEIPRIYKASHDHRH